MTLIEVLVVVAIIIVVLAYAVSHNAGNRRTALGAERAVEAVENRLSERHAAAERLNQIAAPTSLEQYTSPPVEINFADATTTRPLVTDGVDSNDDGVDDNTGSAITRVVPPTTAGAAATWSYAYSGEPLALPLGWSVATTQAQLGGIPLIGGGASGRGALTTRIAFDSRGRAFVPDAGGILSPFPAGANAAAATAPDAPFWAVYIVQSSPDAADGGQAVAVAVHPSGQLERWRWDGSEWRGFRRRTIP